MPMKYSELNIQTQREAPNNARTPGFAFLVRAGYLTREGALLPLGLRAVERLQALSADDSFFSYLSIPILSNERESFFPLAVGPTEMIYCESCNYLERLELAQFKKTALAAEDELPLEKVTTPECSTIESLASFLGLPKEKTAKALMYTRIADGQFIFVVIRGDMQLGETKLKQFVGDLRAATADEIAASGAVPGYASPIALTNALVVVDDLIPKSKNLVAGANETGFHLKNTNYLRDYAADIIGELVQAKAGDPCTYCGNPLSVLAGLNLATRSEFHFENILLALAETHHDAKGLTLPRSVAPFDVYLMHVPGKELDTRASAEELYNMIQSAGISVLFDDREERAGVKFNDADLIGCPLRITVGEKNLKDGMVELKPRKAEKNLMIPLAEVISAIKEVN